jgi:biotin carboxyl carrier protein
VAGASGSAIAQLRGSLDATKAMMLPAPALGAEGYTLSVPIAREGAPLGWLVAQVAVANPRDLQAFVVLLQALAGFLLYREERRHSGELAHVMERTSGLLDIFRRAGAELEFDKACRMALDALRGYLGCGRILLAVRSRGAVRMRAISGMGRIDPKSTSHQPYEAAMAEALRAGRRVDFAPDSPRVEETAAHEILQQQSGAARIVTLPLPRASGALLIEWEAGSPPDAQGARVAEAAAPFLPALFDLLARARPNPVAFTVQRLWGKAGANRRRAILAATGAVAILLAWPFRYPIGADCRLVPTVKQVIAAPFEGQLRQSLVRPGDAVTEGQPLGELDNRELKLKESELIAARDRALKQRDRAMTGAGGEGADFAAAQVAGFEAQSVGEELALVQRKLELLSVKSPLAGVVVSGDLRRVEGQPVQQGQVLWEVAPLEKMIVEIGVPDREVSRVRPGMPVRVRLESFGGQRWQSTVALVHPQSEERDGRNVFIGEAAIEGGEGAAELRPGMRGRAIIASDRRPLAWIIGHRFWDWLVTSLFW